MIKIVRILFLLLVSAVASIYLYAVYDRIMTAWYIMINPGLLSHTYWHDIEPSTRNGYMQLFQGRSPELVKMLVH